MKRVMIYGAGQAGEMAANWIPGDSVLTAFIDGSPAKQGGTAAGVPILSPEEALAGTGEAPDCIFLCVINKEAAKEVTEKIRTLGFQGEVINIPELRNIADLRLAFLRLTALEIRERGIEGDLAELGVYKGDFAKEINALFPERELLLLDTFEGFDDRDLAIEKEKAADGKNARAEAGDFGDTSVDIVKNKLPHPEKAFFLKGYFPESLGRYPDLHPEQRKYCLVSLDTDLYEPTLAGLQFFYPRLEKGGVIIIHDYNSSQFPGVKRAVRAFAEEHGIYPMPLMDLHGTAVLQ